MKLILPLLVILSVGQAQSQSQARAQQWAKTVNSGKENTTTLQFYFHDVLSGKAPSVVPVVHPADNSKSPIGFGTMMMADDKLTVGPEPNSKLVGRAQGLYGFASQGGLASQGDLALIMAMSYNFLEGAYNGSSISIMGRNSAGQPIREMPVVGGTGVFRMARGYAVARTHWLDLKTGDAIVGYNVTVSH